jgi:Tfp pilus assembly protein PilF
LGNWLTVLAFLSISIFVRGQSANSSDAVLLTVSGKVEIVPQGQTVWTPGHAKQVLRQGDRLRTGKDSRATVQLSNLSVLRVYQLTTMEIQAPDQPGHRPVLDLESGAAYFFNRDKPSETQFRTPSASGAIRGTEFNIAVANNGRMELALLDGQVDLTNNEGTAQIHSGQAAVVDPGQAPKKMALVNAVNVIQWTLYYPAILDVDELDWNSDDRRPISGSLDAYRNGDLLQALSQYPEDRTPGTDSERVYRAALLLAVGQVDDAEQLLHDTGSEPRAAALADSLREMIAAVKGQSWTRHGPRTLATEWLAGSYQAQSQRKLTDALTMAKNAVAKAPRFAFAHERLAEMEFSFGHRDEALVALNRSLELAPRNAEALALKGFALAAESKLGPAELYFDQAIKMDGSLGNGWLGRGLVKIHNGDVDGGRKDLEAAAALEPNRAFFRSYLGKAWSLDRPFQYGWNTHLATNELRRAETLDPNDPTAWLYAALLSDQMNMVNQSIRDLEHSEDLNNNRAVFRSKFLLDQDQAVRRANLAQVYEDAGFKDVAVREATRALEDDYANYSAHLFLAETYDALQDPKKEDLRYQTPWEDELLMANLLSPVGAGVLSQNISQQEYSKLFAADGFGISSATEFFSRGAWMENGSQYGTFGPMAYSLDGYYYSDPGWRPNNNIVNNDFSAKVKYQLDQKDTAFLQLEHTELTTGDPFEYYNYTTPKAPGVMGYDPALKEYESEDPNVLAGWRRDWGTGNQTVFLFRTLQDHFASSDGEYYPPIISAGVPPGANPLSFVEPSQMNMRRTTELNSFELQHLYGDDQQNIVVGGRYQNEAMEVSDVLIPNGLPGPLPAPFVPAATLHYDRFSGYGYYTLKLADTVNVTGGLTYDYEHFPLNMGQPPISTQEANRGRLTPKVGIDWTLPCGTRLRAYWSRSMGGLINDSSTTIEPTEIAGFNQSFRSLIPQSAGFGTPPAMVFETYGIGADHKFSTGTYVDAEAEFLTSEGNQQIGSYYDPSPGSQVLSQLGQTQYFREQDAFVSINQLLGRNFSVGARDQVTAVDLTADFYSPGNGLTYPQHQNSTLNEASFYGNFYEPCGFFTQAEVNWWNQDNTLNALGAAEPNSEFWQVNVYAGYRFPRRHIELAIGGLNLFNHNYNIDPVTYFLEQAHNRTFVASCKFTF